jgi:hypothetical protein
MDANIAGVHIKFKIVGVKRVRSLAGRVVHAERSAHAEVSNYAIVGAADEQNLVSDYRHSESRTEHFTTTP